MTERECAKLARRGFLGKWVSLGCGRCQRAGASQRNKVGVAEFPELTIPELAVDFFGYQSV